MDLIETFNSFAWISSNLLIFYTAILVVVFLVSYRLLFDPKATTAGRLIFRFVLSLLGVISLVFIGVWIDPSVGREWSQYPADALWWRPGARLLVYGYVAYTVTSLAILVWVRRLRPQWLLTKPRNLDLRTAENADMVESGPKRRVNVRSWLQGLFRS